MAFSTTPTMAAKLKPDILTLSFMGIPMVIPSLLSIKPLPSPSTKIVPIIIIFFQLSSTLLVFIVLNPTRAIMLKSIKLMPPITEEGMVVSTEPSFEINPKDIANTAASLNIDGS